MKESHEPEDRPCQHFEDSANLLLRMIGELVHASWVVTRDVAIAIYKAFK